MCDMEVDGEWVLVEKLNEKDVWSPGLTGFDESGGGESKGLKVVFEGQAEHWTDAVPIGNGRVGGMMWGGVLSEVINLNESTLWTGTPGDYTNPDAPKALAEVRTLVDAGKYAEATLAAEKLSGKISEAYQLLGDIKIDFDESHGKSTISNSSARQPIDDTPVFILHIRWFLSLNSNIKTLLEKRVQDLSLPHSEVACAVKYLHS